MSRDNALSRPKIGDKTLAASLRLGLAEIRQAASLGGNVEQPTPYGMYGHPTHGDVQGWNAGHLAGSHSYHRMPSATADAHLPTPSQVIDNPQAYSPEKGETQDQAKEHGNGVSLPTPSQVIDNPAAYRPEPSPGQEQQHEHGHEM